MTHPFPTRRSSDRIIRDQVAIGGTALPWADRAAFAELMLGWELRSWHEAHDRAGPVIFDRGVPDVIGYLRLCGLPVRSEEHTSELQSLMCISYAVFCLKKKKPKT